MFKLYLGKILGQIDPHSTSTDSGPLQLYHQFSRNEIGVVLTKKEDLGPPGPFIPIFYMYKDCPVMIDSKVCTLYIFYNLLGHSNKMFSFWSNQFRRLHEV